MSSRRRSVTIELVVDDSDKQKLGGVATEAEGAAAKFKASYGDLAKFAAGAFAVDKLKDFAGELKDVALQAEATTRRSNVVFGDNADAVRAWADSFNESVGVSKSQTEGFAAAMGDLLKPMQFTSEQAAELSPRLVEIGTALGVAAGKGAEAGIEAVSSALVGERERLKEVGVVIKEADLASDDLTGTFEGLTGATDQQRKALDTMTLIVEQGADSLALFDERAGSMGDTLNQASARIEDAKLAIAQGLTPALAEGLEFSVEFIDAARKLWLALSGDNATEVAMITALQNIREALMDGTDATNDFADSVLHVAEKGDLTAAAIDQLRLAAQLNDEQFAAGKAMLRDWAENGAGAGTEAATELLEALGPLGSGLRKRGEDTLVAAAADEEAAAAAVEHADAMDKLATQTEKTVAEYEKQAEANRKLAESNRRDLGPSIEETVDIFQKASDDIEISLDDFTDNLETQIDQQTRFWEAVDTLADAGLTSLVDQLVDAGPRAAGAAEDLVDDMGTALDLESKLSGVGASWASFLQKEVEAMVNDAGPTVAATLESFGIDTADAFARGFLNGLGGLNFASVIDQAITGTGAPGAVVGGGGSDAIRNGGPVPE